MTITKQHRIDLQDVATILSRIDAELDDSLHPCTSCGRDSWADLREGRLGSEIGLMLRKTYKCMGLIKDALKQRETELAVSPKGRLGTDPRRVRTRRTSENP